MYGELKLNKDLRSPFCKTCGCDKRLSNLDVGRTNCRNCYNSARKTENLSSTKLKKRRKLGKASYRRHRLKRIEGVKLYISKHKEKHYEYARKSIEKLRKAFKEYKSKLKCIKCGESHPACLDFHHRDPSKKKELITKLVTRSKRLKREIKKCDVLCSNCHRKLHYKEIKK